MRRVVALAGLVLVVGVAGFAGAALLLGSDDAPPPPPPPTTEALARLKIIFPEGFTVAEMADRVAAVRKIAIDKRGVTPRLTRPTYLSAVARAQPPVPFRRDAAKGSMEGFLFPALYEFTQRTTGAELVRTQVQTFSRRFATVDLSYARSKNLTPYDVLIIASMIEKETAVASERRLVSAVIYNRLRNRMPLGIDATIRYGLDIPGTESLTKSALATDSPYNTRLRTGLPPTPIANPGLASIRAAANPARGVDYLYYVRKPSSLSHYFTADETDFLRKVCEFGYACPLRGFAPRKGLGLEGRHLRRCGDTPRMPSWYRDPEAPEPNRPRKVGVCFIVELDGGVLVDRRSDDGALAFTGGTLEDHESVLEGLARELREETGLEVADTRFIGFFSDPTRLIGYADGSIWPVLSFAFAVTPRPGTAPRISDESLELRVVTREELVALDFAPAHRPIRDAYLAFDGSVVVA